MLRLPLAFPFGILFTGGMIHAALLAVALLCNEDLILGEFSQEGDTGSIPQHIGLVRGTFLEHGASVRLVIDGKSAMMRCDFATTTRSARSFMFVIKGVDTTGWEAGEVRAIPARVKVTGWHKYRTTTGKSAEVQILEPADKAK